ncbi:hypothetical protein K435DRAFT_874771 [Dendrothele bispora CBS 962.96]|uniref:Uncharacterized protein n=1 Tax=Dendrothele bispora (strain CBS 962.96) TaxID=1314807 RepID=A0A4S8KVU3_DENBC|nr:hypothetical protein K435DRAFT_874771 [Dendrothele bispora CBS 962.96]
MNILKPNQIQVLCLITFARGSCGLRSQEALHQVPCHCIPHRALALFVEERTTRSHPFDGALAASLDLWWDKGCQALGSHASTSPISARPICPVYSKVDQTRKDSDLGSTRNIYPRPTSVPSKADTVWKGHTWGNYEGDMGENELLPAHTFLSVTSLVGNLGER